MAPLPHLAQITKTDPLELGDQIPTILATGNFGHSPMMLRQRRQPLSEFGLDQTMTLLVTVSTGVLVKGPGFWLWTSQKALGVNPGSPRPSFLGLVVETRTLLHGGAIAACGKLSTVMWMPRPR
jgi:hypothetical protein